MSALHFHAHMRAFVCAYLYLFVVTTTLSLARLFVFSVTTHPQAFIASSLADVRRHLNTVNLPANSDASTALLRAEQQLQVPLPASVVCT